MDTADKRPNYTTPLIRITTLKSIVHKRISYVKSVMRIIGYAYLPVSILGAALILIGSELLGIAEELFGT